METREILDALGRGSVAVIAAGPDGRIRYANAAAARLAGPLEGLDLSSQPDCGDPRSPRALLVDAWEGLAEGDSDPAPRIVRAKQEGVSLFLWLQILPVGDAGAGGRLFLVNDLTAYLTGSEPVKRLVSQLAHDLRSPLTSVSGAAELLLSGRVGSLAGVQEKLVRIVDDGAGRMASIIRNVAEEDRNQGGTPA